MESNDYKKFEFNGDFNVRCLRCARNIILINPAISESTHFQLAILKLIKYDEQTNMTCFEDHKLHVFVTAPELLKHGDDSLAALISICKGRKFKKVIIHIPKNMKRTIDVDDILKHTVMSHVKVVIESFKKPIQFFVRFHWSLSPWRPVMNFLLISYDYRIEKFTYEKCSLIINEKGEYEKV